LCYRDCLSLSHACVSLSPFPLHLASLSLSLLVSLSPPSVGMFVRVFMCVRARAPSTCVHACAHAFVRMGVGMGGFCACICGGFVVFVFVGGYVGGLVFSLSSSLTQMIRI
jgi:hypothetical protein